MLHCGMLHLEIPWYRDESLWIAISNLILLVLLVVMATRNEQLASTRRRATRKLLVHQRANKGLRYALNITVNQYHSLRRRFDRRRGAPAVPRAATPVALEPQRPAFLVPPPLNLAPAEGEDPESWVDSGIRTEHRPSAAPLLREDTQTQPIPLAELMRLTHPPRK